MDLFSKDATVCEPYPVPQNASLNVEYLVSCLHKRVPGYLKYFLLTEESSKPPPSPQPSAPLQTDPMEEDILVLLGLDKEKSIATPPGPSAQSEVPTTGTSTQPTTKVPSVPSVERETPTFVKPIHSDTSPASSEVEDFTTVTTKSQKRKLKASKSMANPPKKASIAVLTQAPAPATPASTSAESRDSEMVEQKERVPPLYIREKNHWDKILPILDQLKIEFLHARSTAVGIRVQCPDSTNHRRLTATLREKNIGFHTYALPDERVLRVVIRGLPKELDTELIKEDLLSQKLPVREVHRMYHPRNKRPFEMVLVILDHTYEGKKINRISTVCRLSGLKVEPPYTNGRLGQCHRCQLYGHSARNCFAHPRCVKCLGDHGTSDCSRKQPTEEPPSCVLCRTQGHPANYRGCPRAPKEPKRRVKPVARQTAAPAPTFVPAPAPATNAWDRPLLKAKQPAPTPAPTTAAPPAKLAQVKAPVPPPQPPQGSPSPPSQSTAADRAPGNLRYLRYILANIDLERIDKIVSDMRADPLSALEQHLEYIRFIDNLQKTAP